ncbi:MAG TPA: hypothetical protein VG322_06725 [Candidatus Acidoferrales bacterium]|jgi:hypothetical protein|nr:hypothetical protein [Candidatus Acidoferrales bacterium]
MSKRRAIGAVISAARVVGLLLIILALVGLPPLRSLIGRMREPLGFVSSVTLGVVGIVWLIGVQLFLRFFDEFLSRN